jgi:hypothetical protein
VSDLERFSEGAHFLGAIVKIEDEDEHERDKDEDERETRTMGEPGGKAGCFAYDLQGRAV